MLASLLSACVHVPEAPPPTPGRGDTLDTAPPPPLPTSPGGFGTCAELRSALALPGGSYDDATAIAPSSGGDRTLAVAYGGPLTLGGGTEGERTLAPVGEDAHVVARLSADGLPRWTVTLEGTTQAEVSALAGAPDGGVFVAGSGDALTSLGGSAALGGRGESDAFLARLGPDGELAWFRSFGSEGDDRASALVVLPDGEVVVAGTLGGPATLGAGEPDEVRLRTEPGAETTAFLARYGSDGGLRWARAAGGAAFTWVDAVAYHAATDALALSGSIAGDGATVFDDAAPPIAPAGQDAFVARYDAAGAFRWVADAGGASASGLAFAADGELLASGTLVGVATFGRGQPNEQSFDPDGAEAWAARYAADGALRWVLASVSDDGGFARGAGIAAHRDGAAWLGGFALGVTFADTRFVAASRDAFVALLDADGVPTCAVHLPADPSDASAWALEGIGTRPDGDLDVFGSFDGTVGLAAGTDAEVWLESAGATDAIVLTIGE